MDPFEIKNLTTGFGNPARSYVKNRLNPSDILVKNPSSTFFFSWEGDNNYGISNGDILVVDRALDPKEEDIVVVIEKDKLKCFKFIEIGKETEIWGTITWKLTDLRK